MDAARPDLADGDGKEPMAQKKAAAKGKVDGPEPPESSNPPAGFNSDNVSSKASGEGAALSKAENDAFVSMIRQKIPSVQDKKVVAPVAQNVRVPSEGSSKHVCVDAGQARDSVPEISSAINPVSPSSDTDHTLRLGSSVSPVHLNAEKVDPEVFITSDNRAEPARADNTKEAERLDDCDDSIPRDIKDVKVSGSAINEVPMPINTKASSARPALKSNANDVASPVHSPATTAKTKSRKFPSPKSLSPYSSPTTGSDSLRRGKWTVEEEAYVTRVIEDFNGGFLKAPAGTTLRSYLSEKLNCDPMRITKKFTGEACIGKRVFHPTVRTPANADLIDNAQVRVKSAHYQVLTCVAAQYNCLHLI